MARTWTGKAKEPEPEKPKPEQPKPKGTKTCPRCGGGGEIHVVSAKTKEHGGFDDYDEPCPDCGGTGEVSK